MRRKESLYAVIGGVVGAVVTMAVCSVMPIGAQSGDVNFGEITCTGLSVVDAEGKSKVWLRNIEEYGGQVSVFGKGGEVWLVTEKDGGRIWVNGKGGGVILKTEEHGGSITAYGKDIGSTTRGAVVDVGEHGGIVGVYGKGSDKLRAIMGVNEYGNGAVDTWDKNGYRLATLK